jgi:ketosteroid isomerase-like protein
VTPEAGELVRQLYEAFQQRDWDACVPLLHPDATSELPRSGERFDGADAVLEANRSYPEPWGELAILRIVGEGEEAAAEIEVTGGADGDWRMAAFWTVREGRLYRGVEYWVPLRRR